MNKKSTISLTVIALVGITIQYLKLGSISLTHEFLSNITTFLSIVFGFYITSLAVFSSSKYVTSLYKIVDKEDSSKTLLHVLISNYKTGLMLALFSIMYFLSIELFLMKSSASDVNLSNAWLTPFLSIMLCNFYYSYQMLSDLLRVIVQEAKKSK